MEEFRPGDMALMRDKYDQGYTLKKKEHPGRIFTSGLGGDEGNAAAAADGTAESSSAPATADDLTRSMNPAVFSGGDGDSSGSGAPLPDNFMPAPAPPVTIYPLDGY